MAYFKRRLSPATCYCAFCRSPRPSPPRRTPGLLTLSGLVVASFLAMNLIWGQWDARVFLVFAFLLTLVEVGFKLRWRMALVCRFCGFDPALYLRKPNQAAERVKLHLEKRSQNPLTLFSKQPRLNLPVRRVRKPDIAPKEPGSLISKSV